MRKMLEFADFHPFIRCVGRAKYLRQELFHKAYDYRMMIFYSGKGTLEVNDSIYETSKNEVYIISPGVRYRVISKGCQDIIVVNFDMTQSNCTIDKPVPSVPEDFFMNEKITEVFDLSLFFGENGDVIKRILPPEKQELGEQMLEAYIGEKSRNEDILISALLSQLMYYLITERGKKNKNPLASEIYRYISENYNTALTLEKTAQLFHVHPTYLNRILGKNYNTSFRQLLLKTRFSQALHLIDNTDLPIKEIAEKVGFNDSAYFSYAFYKHFGFYPSMYRK